ncbi:hypothetical protein KBC59_03410 [Patescibacteria group bacterium]|nr:hypothetical protein [Patescibacteria group bacterium]
MSAPVLPGSLRGNTPVQGFAMVGFAAVASAALSAYLSDARPPALGEIVIGVLPHVVLIIAVVTFVVMRFLRERLRSALDLGIESALIGLLVGALVSVTGWFSDGTTESAIIASDAFSFVVTGGIFPISIGPSVAVRFLPIIAAAVVAFRFRRRSSVPHLALGVLFIYLIPCAALLSTTVIGMVSAALSGSLASDTATLFKTLVTAHADGYWTATQSERFLLPVARQAENSLLAFRSAIALIFAGGLVIASMAGSSATGGLLKRLVVPEAVRLFLIAICGLALGLASASPSTSHTAAFALILGTLVLLAWVAAFRFRMDLVNLPRHEREHPDYPLPSGAIQAQDLEIVIVSLFGFSLMGATVLGYPVFVALLAATLCARLSEEASPQVPVAVTWLMSAVMLLALAEAGGLTGSRLLAVPGWVSRIFLALSLISVLSAIFDRYLLKLESRVVAAIGVILGLIGIAILSNQIVFWIAVGLSTGILLFSVRSPGKWHRYSSWAFEGAIALVALLSLIVPQFFRRF